MQYDDEYAEDNETELLYGRAFMPPATHPTLPDGPDINATTVDVESDKGVRGRFDRPVDSVDTGGQVLNTRTHSGDGTYEGVNEPTGGSTNGLGGQAEGQQERDDEEGALSGRSMSELLLQRVRKMVRNHSADALVTFRSVLTTCLMYMVDQPHVRGADASRRTRDDQLSDRAFTLLFRSLLTQKQQRLVFLEFVSDTRRRHHIDKLFGKPPYNFLYTNDCQLLNATGISKSRARMTYEQQDRQHVPSHTQIGQHHYTDRDGRFYSIAHRCIDTNSNIFDNIRQNVAVTHQLLLYMMLPIVHLAKRQKRPRFERVNLPVVGESIDLIPDGRMCALVAEDVSQCRIRVQVEKLMQPQGLKRVYVVVCTV